MAADTDSVRENMTRLRMRMVQQKLANERERLQRPESEPSDNNGYENQMRLQQAMLRRQELLDRIRQEQLEDRRPRTYTPRRRFTPSPLPPPSRRSLPDINHKTYHFGVHNPDMSSQVKHVIEHQFRPAPAAPAAQPSYQLPPIQPGAVPALTALPAMSPRGEVVPVQPIQPIQPVQPMTYPAYSLVNLDSGGRKGKDTMFNKADFMDMMMLQNAQMHHMVMQQMMLHQLPGGNRPMSYPAMPAEQMMPMPMVRQPASVYHHHINSQPYQQPPMDYRGGGGNYGGMARNRSYSPPGPPRRPQNRKGLAPAVIRTDLNKGAARPSSVFLFGIILKEIVAALHRIYLNPNGNIYPVMLDVISPAAQDLSQLLTGDPDRRQGKDDPRGQLLQVLQYVIENLTYHMTEIMPKAGVLGTHSKSAVYEMIKSGKRFPDGYFWQIELDRLEFNNNGRTASVGNLEAFILLVGIFLSRSLITTLLLKPVDYGMSSEPLTDVAERNIKILSTCMLFLVRRVSTKRDSPMLPMPGEVSRYVFSDEDMRQVHLKLRRTYEYCENLLREWGAEYIKRLRQATSLTVAK